LSSIPAHVWQVRVARTLPYHHVHQRAFDTRWSNDILNRAFRSLTASDFEVIQRGWQPQSSSLPVAPLNLRIIPSS
jgi:hypothetical protein